MALWRALLHMQQSISVLTLERPHLDRLGGMPVQAQAGAARLAHDQLTPIKYPEIFAASDAIVLNKIDLIENEGKLLAVVAPEHAPPALAAMRAHTLGQAAAIVGEVRTEPAAMIFLRTDIGGAVPETQISRAS
jgi:hypothetical protein